MGACGLQREVTVGGFVVKEYRLRAGYRLLDHVHPRAGIVLCRYGSYTAEFGGVRYRVDPGAALVLPAGHWHREYGDRAESGCFLLEPLDGRCGQLQRAGLCLDRRQRRSNPALASMTRRLSTWIGVADPTAMLLLESVVLEISALLARSASVSQRPAASAWLDRAWTAVHHEPQRWSVGALAQHLGVSPQHLSRSFRRQYGVAPSECLQHNRLDLAAQRIRATGAPLAGIASACGFVDQSHLTRAFRRRYGVTPGALRRLDRHPGADPR